MDELKSCPFCGKTVANCCTVAECDMTDFDSADYIYNSMHYTVVCNYNKGGCGASCGGYHSNEESAIEAWNRRANEKDS